MDNVLTTHEVLSQYGHIDLHLELYHLGHFVFKGQSRDNFEIMLTIKASAVQELIPHKTARLNQFSRTLLKKPRPDWLKVMVIKNGSTIYQS